MAVIGAHRLHGLDSLRGVAALTVVLNHISNAVPPEVKAAHLSALVPSDWTWPWLWLRYTPGQILVSGRPAVLLFFVLSGFVLTLPFARGRSYLGYLAQRLLRIWPPLAAAVCLAWLAQSGVAGMGAPGASAWLNQQWTGGPAWGDLGGPLVMRGGADDMRLDPVIWSLIHEVRIAVVLPLLAGAAWRLGPAAAIVVAAAASLTAGASGMDAYGGSLRLTVHFVFPFVLGAVLALRREAVCGWLARWPGWAKAAAWVAVTVGLMAPGPILVADFVLAGASTLLLALVLHSAAAQALLAAAALRWLGRISFSLYLTHFIVLLMVVRLLGPAPLWLSLTATLVVALLVAEGFFRLVEQPSHRLARRVGCLVDARWQASRPRRAASLRWNSQSGAAAAALPNEEVGEPASK